MDASGFASGVEASRARFTRPDRQARLLRRDGSVALLFDSTATGFRVRPDTGTVAYALDHAAAERLTAAAGTLRAQPATTAAPPRR